MRDTLVGPLRETIKGWDEKGNRDIIILGIWSRLCGVNEHRFGGIEGVKAKLSSDIAIYLDVWSC